MDKKQITIEVRKELLEQYEHYYTDVHKGIELGVNAWLNIRRDNIYKMNGYFTKDEVKFLLDFVKDIDQIENYYDLSIDLLIQVEEYSCRDIDGLFNKHNVNQDVFYDKIRTIGIGKSLAIIDWAKAYWINGTFKETSMEDYIKVLTERSKEDKILDKIKEVCEKSKDLDEAESSKLMQEAISKSDIHTLIDGLLGFDD